MFHEFDTVVPSLRSNRYDPDRVTSVTRYGPSHNGNNLCQSFVVWILRRTRSPTSYYRAITRFAWLRLIACWWRADKMTAASRSSSILSRSVTRDSSEFCSLYNWTRRDLNSISVGNMAFDPYTRLNGDCPVALLGVVRSPRVMRRVLSSTFLHTA